MEENLKLVIVLVFAAVVVYCGAFIYDIYYKPKPIIEERTIIVADKTAELVPVGVSWTLDFRIIGDDGVVYHTEVEIFSYMKVGKKYNILAEKIPSSYGEYWRIKAVREDKSQTKGGT